MKGLIYISVVLFIAGCGGGNIASSMIDDFGKTKIYCKSPRPQICTMQYAPVCGKPTNKTYSNGCFACKDTNVLYFTRGKCE